MDVQAGDSIKDRLSGVFDRTRRAMLEAGRDEGSVRLVAASKAVSIDRIREAINAGVQIAGENRLQEALPKIEALKGEKILLEINLGVEQSKAGFLADEVEQALPQLAALNHVAIEGLMAVPPSVREAEQSRPYFRRLRELAVRLANQGLPGISLKELSMGMSNDYVVAIQEGATLIRLGTAIFGGRRG